MSDETSKDNKLGLTVGDAVFVRCAAYHYTGRVVSVHDGVLHLTDAAWIADSGRWNSALRTGKLSEVEPEPGGVFIALGSVFDWRLWAHELPSAVK